MTLTRHGSTAHRDSRSSKTSSRSRNTDPAEQIQQHLAQRIGRHRFDMWFEHAARLNVRGKKVEVAAESKFVADWIDSHFMDDLRTAVDESLGSQASIKVHVAPDDTPRADSAGTLRERRSSGRKGSQERTSHVELKDSRRQPRRIARYRRLDDFVVGQCNSLAYNAALRMAGAEDASTISPLFLYGDCGLGKTHLLQSICEMYVANAGRRHGTRYMTGEQFTNDYVLAVKSGRLDEFRKELRNLELLAVDDVHYLSNKIATQREFLHTMDALSLAGGRMALASTNHPRAIKKLGQALVSRFVSGMTVSIEMPDWDTRVTLIPQLAKVHNLQLKAAAIETIARHCVGSIRELEGAMTKLAAMRLLPGKEKNHDAIGMVTIEQLFKEASFKPTAPVRIGTIIELVCERVGIEKSDLFASSRHKRVVLGRALIAFLARELTTLSYPEIAQALGRAYHSTIHSAAARLARQMANDESVELLGTGRLIPLQELVDQLRHQIYRAAMVAG